MGERCAVGMAAFCFCALQLSAQTQAQAVTATPRLAEEIDNSQRAAIPGSHSPKARPENETGRVPGGTKLQSMSIVFSRSAQQEADLQNLIAAQQNPASPQYHKWLSPDDFAARFGLADADIAKVTQWLQRQGFTVDSVARSKNRINFSGTVLQAETAFATELHYYTVNGQQHFAPSTDISVPAALAGVVQNVTNLSTFKPRSHVIRRPIANFTSAQTGNHFLTPKDLATIYDITPAYNAGLNGTGQSIAVVGQSAVALTDIENFQSAAGLTKKDPTVILVPNSGTSTTVTGDESESDLDLEYAGGTAPGATIIFVYVGNSPNTSVWNSLVYAVDNKTAPIISTSYGDCETVYSPAEYSSMNGVLAQAAAQGQTVVAPSGDSGSTDCSGISGLTIAQQQALAVDFPASSQYATGMGGSEFPAADVATTASNFWTPANGSDVIGSAISYIPEQVWNDDDPTAPQLSAGGGGASALTARPSWQTGVPGIPPGTFRLVPDISLTASPNNAGFLYCSSDSSTKITGSCANGFRDGSNTNLTVAGGTSFDVPMFAGMVAIINQKLSSTGQGVVNPTLYSLAANSATYAAAFHDITSGNNECLGSATLCAGAGTTQFSAGTGYDEASGLGSLDFAALLAAWPANTTSLLPTSTTLTAATTTPASGASDVITITVAPTTTSATVPTGTLSVSVDGSVVNSTLPLGSAGAATYTFSSTTAGAHTITATYSGDGTYATSTGGPLTLAVGGTASKAFTLSATNVTVAAGSSGTSTVTVTPQNGYTGTISLKVSSSPSVANACFVISNTTVSGTSAVTAMLTVDTTSTACASAAIKGGSGQQRNSMPSSIPIAHRNNDASPVRGGDDGSLNYAQAGVGFAGLLFAGLLGFRSRTRKLSALAGILLLAAMGWALSGCSSSGSSSSSTSSSSGTAAKGTYTLTVVGTDTTTLSITASTTLTLTID